MERYNPLLRLVLAGALCILLLQAFSQDQTIGINTDAPNAHAVLHLHAPDGDQGLLVPTLSSTQRGGMSLDSQDNGLLVYDTNDNLFYYWHAPSWVAISVTDGQRLTLDGNTLSIENGNEVDLSAIVPTISTPAAEEVSYSSDSSQLGAATVQEAIDILDERLDAGNVGGDAANVVYTGDGTGLTATTVQAAIDEFHDKVYSTTSVVDIPGQNLDFDDTNASFAASNVQEALEHLDGEISRMGADTMQVDERGNHLVGTYEGIPSGENNILIGNGTATATSATGSYNMLFGHGSRANTSNVNGIGLGTGTFLNGNRGVAIGTGARIDGGAENAMAFGTNTTANQTNSILFGDGVSSPTYFVGVNVQNPTTALQVGRHLGFFHYEGTNSDGEVMSDNIYGEGTKLYARTAGKEGVVVVMEEGAFKVFNVAPQATAHALLNPEVDFEPLLYADVDTLTVNATARISGTVSIGADQSGGMVIPGTLEYDFNDAELNVHNGSEWRRVVTESYIPEPVVVPTPMVVPSTGVISKLPESEYFPLEADSFSANIVTLPDGVPGQVIRITNSGTAANGTENNSVVILDYSSTGGDNVDIQGDGSVNQVYLSVGSAIQFLYDNTLGRWVELSRSINGL